MLIQQTTYSTGGLSKMLRKYKQLTNPWILLEWVEKGFTGDRQGM